MLRISTLLALLAGLASIAAYRAEGPGLADRPLPVNSMSTGDFNPRQGCSNRFPACAFPASWAGEADSTTSLRVLMINYCAYDSAYAGKIRRLLQRRLPSSYLSDFWDGSAADLSGALAGSDVAIIVYPSGGAAATVRAYGKALALFMRGGGTVILTGTHEYGILQQLGLFELDYGYFCADPALHGLQPEHPLLNGTPESFRLTNYAYPLDVSDPNFVTLAEVRGYPVIGYKNQGNGKVIYLGLEYYFEEPTSTRILLNALRWIAPARSAPATTPAPVLLADAAGQAAFRPVKRSEEYLVSGSGPKPAEAVELKIFPNPYFSKATLDLELTRTAPVTVEMTDETGRLVGLIVTPRTLTAGSYRFDLPNVGPGVYFVHCKVAGRTSVRKVVKTEAN
jgi:hypothetical protein